MESYDPGCTRPSPTAGENIAYSFSRSCNRALNHVKSWATGRFGHMRGRFGPGLWAVFLPAAGPFLSTGLFDHFALERVVSIADTTTCVVSGEPVYQSSAVT